MILNPLFPGLLYTYILHSNPALHPFCSYSNTPSSYHPDQLLVSPPHSRLTLVPCFGRPMPANNSGELSHSVVGARCIPQLVAVQNQLVHLKKISPPCVMARARQTSMLPCESQIRVVEHKQRCAPQSRGHGVRDALGKHRLRGV